MINNFSEEIIKILKQDEMLGIFPIPTTSEIYPYNGLAPGDNKWYQIKAEKLAGLITKKLSHIKQANE